MSETILVAGGGLAGSLTAIYLARAGHRVEIHERRPDPRRAGASAGRSINLAISARGIEALRGVGLAERVLAGAVPMRGRMVHGTDGSLAFQPYGSRSDQVINSISRSGLNMTLLEAAEAEANVRVHFGERVAEVDLERPALVLEDPASGGRRTATGTRLVGADGAFSAVRAAMQRLDRFDYSQSYLDHGYKELAIPPAAGGGFRIEPNALHIWPRGGFMMIALPNLDGSFTCTLFWPFTGPNSFERLRTPDEIRAFFGEVFPDALPLMPTLVEDYLANPTSSLVTVRARPWQVGGRVVLVGDACHAVVPFYGQGANAAFEDCVVLDAAVREHAGDWERAFAHYEASRKRHADALADLAIDNFLEMRDRVASPAFRAKKRLEHLLAALFPRRFLPLYWMVSFSRIPYDDARERARRQWRLVRRAAIGAGAALGAIAAALLWWARSG